MVGLFKFRTCRLSERCLELKDPSAVIAVDRVLWDEDPVIRELAKITHNIFKEVANGLNTSNVKQSLQRLFKFIYTKKLKPLYNYKQHNNLTGSPEGIKETKNDKEGLMDENFEEILGKDERFTRASEEE